MHIPISSTTRRNRPTTTPSRAHTLHRIMTVITLHTIGARIQLDSMVNRIVLIHHNMLSVCVCLSIMCVNVCACVGLCNESGRYYLTVQYCIECLYIQLMMVEIVVICDGSAVVTTVLKLPMRILINADPVLNERMWLLHLFNVGGNGTNITQHDPFIVFVSRICETIIDTERRTIHTRHQLVVMGLHC